ncbi:MAG TPA: hypothetical protein VF080_06200, partial [Solirubrobacteraceae bacterium]
MPAPAIAEGRVAHVADELADGVRRQDLAAVRAIHHARRQVDGGSEQLVAAVEHLAGVQADPHADRVLTLGQ